VAPRYVAALLSLLLLGCAPAPDDPVDEPPVAAPSDQAGPYEVGATTIRFVDHRDKFLAIEVWYPALPEEGAELEPYEELQLLAATYRDAPQDLRGAPYPLVAFSHGYGGIRYQSSDLVTHLASHGFVVAAVDHIGNTLLDLDEDAATRVAVERPEDISVMVDIVGDLLPSLVQPDDGFAMVGHSFGGWTTLVVGGGLLDREFVLAHCAEHDERGCRFFDPDNAATADLEQATPDPRARVAVALAPGLAYSFGPAGVGLAGNVPTLVQGGTADADMPYETEIRPVYEALGGDASLASLAGAGHFGGFSDLCLLLPLDECNGAADGWMEPDRAQELTRVLTTAWIRSRWLGEESEEDLLQPWVDATDDATWEPQ